MFCSASFVSSPIPAFSMILAFCNMFIYVRVGSGNVWSRRAEGMKSSCFI
jgi:hypothetical protein